VQAGVAVLLRDALADVMRRYVDVRYSAARAAVGVHLNLAEGFTPAVSLEDATAAPHLALCLSAEQENSAAAWCGRWVTHVDVTIAGDDFFDAAAAGNKLHCAGLTKVFFHYTEEGNVQMEAEHPFEFDVEFPVTNGLSALNVRDFLHASSRAAFTADDPADEAREAAMKPLVRLARRVSKQVEAAEDAFQAEVTEACGPSLGDDAMRRLRRKLPVTKALFDFGATHSTRQVFQTQQRRKE
jgi:hypothetical protein